MAANGFGTGLTTNELQSLATLGQSNWDLPAIGGTTAIWRIYDGHTYPMLRSFMSPLTVTARDVNHPIDGKPAVTTDPPSFIPYDFDFNKVIGTVSYSGDAIGAVDIGTYSIIPSGLYSNQQGYDISYANGTLTIYQPDPVNLNIIIQGNDSVTAINQNNSNHSCNSQTCDPMQFMQGDQISLSATGSNSSFSNWNGGYASNSTPGSFVINADTNVTATFIADPAKAMVEGSQTPYYTLFTALSTPVQNATIRARNQIFTESFVFNNSHDIKLRGGFASSDFADNSQTGFTSISGVMKVKSGTLRVERLKIMP